MQIGNLNTNNRTLLVAEIGNNHEGNLSVAHRLIDAAVDAKVDAVKFQIFRTEEYVDGSDLQRFKRLKSFELTYQEFEKLADHAREAKLAFIATPFDLSSLPQKINPFMPLSLICFKVLFFKFVSFALV